MKILFAMSSPEYLRFYDSTIVELASRGHDVVVAVNSFDERKPVRFEALGDTGGRVTIAGMVPPRGDVWPAFAHWVRGTMDWARYLHPRLASAATLRARMKRQGLPLLLQWADAIRSLPPAVVERIMRTLAACERAIPVAPPLIAFLDTHRPDLLLVSPLVEAASEQVDLVRAARARGIRTAAMIASWDNLTNKGDLRVPTDRVVVWNDAQKREAVELHRVPAERVAVTGSQVFDRWFGRSPSRTRDEFCAQVGLPPGKPFVLFVGSSVFISRANVEVPFVRRWIETLRASGDPAVRGLGVLIRPHPYNGAQWAEADLSGLGDVAVWPRGKHNPIDELNRADFFDSMHHSAGVVGINTSAMIEAAIVGRPVFSVLTPEFSGGQEGTLHFHHLLPESGGFLRVASTLDEHVAQLSAVLANPESARHELVGFVRAFIRPHGLDRACTPLLADTVEQLGREPVPEAAGDTAAARLLRVLLYPVALFAAMFPEEALRKKRANKWLRERWRKAVRAWEKRSRRWAAGGGRSILGRGRWAVGGSESAAGDRHVAAGGRESGVGRRASAVDGLESAAGDRHVAAGGRESGVGRRASAMGGLDSAVGARHSSRGRQHATASNSDPGGVRPTADARRPTPDHRPTAYRLQPTALLLCAVAPFVAATVVVLAFAASELAGKTPFAHEPPANIAEAAGMGLSSEVLRFLRAGEDPHTLVRVRPHVISSEVTQVAAVEAAVWSRRIRLMQLLEREGALDDGGERGRLACLALDIRATEVAEFLARGALPTCEPGATADAIAARSR